MAKKLWIHNAVDDVNIYTYICQHGKKKQTLKMLITVVLVYTICWLPLNLYLVLLSSESVSSHNGLYFFLPGWQLAAHATTLTSIVGSVIACRLKFRKS